MLWSVIGILENNELLDAGDTLSDTPGPRRSGVIDWRPEIRTYGRCAPVPPRKYGNMTTTDETQEQWLPLGVEAQQAVHFSAPWREIPDWFQESLWEWIGINLQARNPYDGGMKFKAGLILLAERKLHVELPHLEEFNVDTGPAAVRKRYGQLGPTALLTFVDFLLSELPEDHVYLEILEALLVEAGSGWRLGIRSGKNSLVQRLPAGVTDAAAATVQLGDAGRRLAGAWEAIFGISPDPSNGYRLAVKAVEDAAIPVVCPQDATATLGKVIGQVNAGAWKLPHLREDPNATTHDVLVGMMRTLWVGQHDRHGGPSAVGVPAVTQHEAESAVMLAVTLVGWFETGKVQQ